MFQFEVGSGCQQNIPSGSGSGFVWNGPNATNCLNFCFTLYVTFTLNSTVIAVNDLETWTKLPDGMVLVFSNSVL